MDDPETLTTLDPTRRRQTTQKTKNMSNTDPTNRPGLESGTATGKQFLPVIRQQYHQYQQNDQSYLTLNHGTYKKTKTYDVGNPGHGLRQRQLCGGT